MSKRLFQILDEMNVSDEKNKTRNVTASYTVLDITKCRQGGKITMGIAEEIRQQLTDDAFSDRRKKVAVLVVIDMESYHKIEKEDEND